MAEEILLTKEIYEKIMGSLVSEIITQKQLQGETANKIEIEIQTLKELKRVLKETRLSIRTSKKNLKKYEWDLAKTNDTLRAKHDLLKGLDDQFISDEETYIDPDYYLEKEETKKR